MELCLVLTAQSFAGAEQGDLPFQIGFEIVVGSAEAFVAAADKGTLRAPDSRCAFRVGPEQRRAIGLVDLPIQPSQRRVGADGFFNRAPGDPTIEGRCLWSGFGIALRDLVADCGAVLGRRRHARVELEGLFVTRQRGFEIAFALVGRPAIIPGENECRIECDGVAIVGDRPVQVTFELIGVAAVGVEFGFLFQADGLVVVRDGEIVIACA